MGGSTGKNEEPIRDLGDAGVRLDAQAKANYKKHLKNNALEREAAIARKDKAAIQRLDKDTELVRQALKSGTKLGGRDARELGHYDRARNAVGRAISRALDKMKEPMPDLHAHLDNAIKNRFARPRYQPDTTTHWKI